MKTQQCTDEKCHIPRPHIHTGEMVDTTYDEWWCPAEEGWVWCPGPCPDGTAHGPKRTIPTISERIKLL